MDFPEPVAELALFVPAVLSPSSAAIKSDPLSVSPLPSAGESNSHRTGGYRKVVDVGIHDLSGSAQFAVLRGVGWATSVGSGWMRLEFPVTRLNYAVLFG